MPTDKSKREARKTLAEHRPDIAAEWHFEKNGHLLPSEVSSWSHTKVWWRCSLAHEWSTRIGARTNGSNCPHCANLAVRPEISLAITRPDLAREWHSLKNGDRNPLNTARGDARKYWWKCAEGHEWLASPNKRSNPSASGRCPFCSGRIAMAGNCLATLFPNLAQEWHPSKNHNLSPSNVLPGSTRKIWWRCAAGHEWHATPASRSKRGTGCRICSCRIASPFYNLASAKPGLAQEWHPIKNGGLTPEKITPSSAKKIWWRCTREHEWQASVSNRNKGKGCPFCSPSSSAIEIRIYAELAAQIEGVLHRHRIGADEVDVFLSFQAIAIEFDGVYWHKKSMILMNKKGSVFGIWV